MARNVTVLLFLDQSHVPGVYVKAACKVMWTRVDIPLPFSNASSWVTAFCFFFATGIRGTWAGSFWSGGVDHGGSQGFFSSLIVLSLPFHTFTPFSPLSSGRAKPCCLHTRMLWRWHAFAWVSTLRVLEVLTIDADGLLGIFTVVSQDPEGGEKVYRSSYHDIKLQPNGDFHVLDTNGRRSGVLINEQVALLCWEFLPTTL